MLVIRTNYDVPTNYTYLWTNELIAEAKRKGFEVTLIEGKDISLKNVKSRIKKLKPNFIMFNGHGSKTSMKDNQDKPFIDVNSSNVFKNTVTFARACDCLQELGVRAVEKGCNAFIGYKKKFWIARSHKYECQPLKDKIAKPILECSNTVVKELLKGKPVKEAVEQSHIKSADYILELIYSKEPLAGAALQAIVANDSTLGFEGNSSAKIY